MKATICLTVALMAIGMFALTASATERDSRADVVIVEAVGDTGRPTGGTTPEPEADCDVNAYESAGGVYRIINTFDPDGIADDLSLEPGTGRELISYRVKMQGASPEDTHPDFRVMTYLMTGNPTDGPLEIIEGTTCEFEGLNRVDLLTTAGQTCKFPLDSGIVLDDTIMGFSVIFDGDPDTNNPGHGIAGRDGVARPGSSADGCGAETGFFVGNPVDGWRGGSFGSSYCPDDPDVSDSFQWKICTADAASIPTVSEWGLAIIVMLVLTGGTIVLRRSRRVATT